MSAWRMTLCLILFLLSTVNIHEFGTEFKIDTKLSCVSFNIFSNSVISSARVVNQLVGRGEGNHEEPGL